MAAAKSFQNMDSPAVKSFDQNVNLLAPSHLKSSRVPQNLSIRSDTEDNETDTSTASRLSSDQIRVLEDHFQKEPKPGTEVKKRLAEQLKLSLSRVNNWYQNRRAKASHQKSKLVPIDAASILDTSGYHVDEEVFPRHFPNIKGERLVSDLHLCCIQVLHECRQSPAAISPSFKDLDHDLLDEQLGRLFLWGQGFEPEKLEDALDQSNELREMVLESLCKVGKLIIHDLLPLTEALLASQDYLPRRVQDLELLITRAQSSMSRTHELGSESEEEEEAFEDVSSEDDVEVSDLGVNLEFHVQCLMDLIPSLQQNIAHAEKFQANFSTEQRQILLSWLNKHMNDPYPKKHEVVELAAQTNLTENQVREWYTRYRKRNPKRISHKQPHNSSDASATPTMTDIDESVDIGEPLEDIMEVESQSPSLQETWLLYRSSSSLDTYHQMSSRDETISRSTADSSQSDNNLPYFSTRWLGYSRSRQLGTFPASRTGAERSHQFSSQQSGHSVTSNDTAGRRVGMNGEHMMQPPRFAPERQGDMRFQCTVCNRCHRDKSDWIQDEETHNPQEEWICMHQGPLLVCDEDKTCAFCGESNPTDEHLDSEHNTFLCSQKPVEQRTFGRPDNLHRHMNDSHKAKIETPPNSWRVSKQESDTQQFWCGFCPRILRTWKSRLDHIADHYTKDNFDMTLWKPEPRF
ncbi:hypothetical protein MMC29_004190 [Sticta canariensis]|nr:hypothetical protein [Sticta canariensis]